MHVDDDHLYYGAGVIQVAEDPHFTAINAFVHKGKNSRCAFVVNHDIGLYMKYRTRPVGSLKEYQFVFNAESLEELGSLQTKTGKVFLGLVCVHVREICCLPLEDLTALIARRRRACGANEDQYTILVTAEAGKSHRVYVNAPGTRGKLLGKALVVARSAFPAKLFE